MEEIQVTKAIPLSELPEIEDITGYWVFGSTESQNGAFESGRFSLARYLGVAVDKLQLERRINFTVESEIHEMLISEPMTIYKVDSEKLDKLEISQDSGATWTNMPLKGNANIVISARKVIKFRFTYTSLSTKAFINLFAKVKI